MTATPIVPTPQEVETRNLAEAMGSMIRSKGFHDFARASYLVGQSAFMGSVGYSLHHLWKHIDAHKRRLDRHQDEIERLDSNQEAILGFVKALVDHTEDGAEAYLRLAEDDPGSTLDEVVDRVTAEDPDPKPGEVADDEPLQPKADEIVDWRDEEPVSDAAVVEVVHEDEED